MIRDFKPADGNRCREIAKQCLDGMVGFDDATRRYLERKFTEAGNFEKLSERCKILVYERDIRVIGFGVLKANEIKHIYVSPEFQKFGIGSAILKQIEEIAKVQGSTEILIYSLADAVSFFRKMGYMENGRHVIERSIPYVKIHTREMRKRV